MKTISNPTGPKKCGFAAAQEAVRKDVERAFGVLQARWGIVRGAAMMWDPEVVWQVMTCCVILHNMIVEDEGEGAARTDFEKAGEHVHLPEQEAEHACTSLIGIDNFEMNKCTRNYSMIWWSICISSWGRSEF